METTQLRNFTVSFENSREFHTLKDEIFTKHCYEIELNSDSPSIIDAGAHIGLATLFFKSKWPKARIKCIEPNPAALQLLRLNIEQNVLQETELFPVALNSSAEECDFYIDSTDQAWFSTASLRASGWTGRERTSAIKVQTERLDDFIEGPTDLLKIDIEGYEYRVLKSCRKLALVSNIFVEFHPVEGVRLQQMQALLAKSGFELSYWQDGVEVDPYKAEGLLLIQGIRVAAKSRHQ